MNTELLKVAKEKQRSQVSELEKLAKKKQDDAKKVRDASERLRELIAKIEKGLEKYKDMELKTYYFQCSYERRGECSHFNVHNHYGNSIDVKNLRDLKLVNKDTAWTEELKLAEGLVLTLTTFVDAERKPTISLRRTAFKADDVIKYLDIKIGYHFTGSPGMATEVNQDFTSVKSLLAYIDDFVTSTLDIEECEKTMLQIDKVNILREYLALGPDTKIELTDQSKNSIGHRFKAGDKEYRILKSDEVKPWFARLVELRPAKHLDLSCLSKAMDVSVESLDKLVKSLNADELTLVLARMGALEKYGRLVAEKQDFSQFVVAFKGVYVVDCARVD